MIGLLTIGLIGLALCKKRGVAGVGAISRFEWVVYRDLIHKIEDELRMYIEGNENNLYDFGEPLYQNPRLDIMVSPLSRSGYDFEVIIDDYSNFKYPNRTHDLSQIIYHNEQTGYDEIDYEVLESIVLNILERQFGSVAGIGAPYKRRIYREIERVQRYVDFDNAFENQSQEAIRVITKDCDMLNSKYPNRKPLTPKKYYNQLRRAYQAISGIGATKLPYKTYEVYNKRGDLILTHRDYGTEEEMFREAINWIENTLATVGNGKELGFWETVIAIATGTKFVWSSHGIYKGVQQVAFARSSQAERKARISYLTSRQKGGKYPEEFAQSALENFDGFGFSNALYDGYIDLQEFEDGMHEAFRNVTSTKAAKDLILEYYIQQHTFEDVDESPDTPF